MLQVLVACPLFVFHLPVAEHDDGPPELTQEGRAEGHHSVLDGCVFEGIVVLVARSPPVHRVSLEHVHSSLAAPPKQLLPLAHVTINNSCSAPHMIAHLALLLKRGFAACLLLVIGLELHKNTQKYLPLAVSNLNSVLTPFTAHGITEQQLQSVLPFYCQALVLMSLLVVCGTRLGKALAWIVAGVNILLTWHPISPLFAGIHLITLFALTL